MSILERWRTDIYPQLREIPINDHGFPGQFTDIAGLDNLLIQGVRYYALAPAGDANVFLMFF